MNKLARVPAIDRSESISALGLRGVKRPDTRYFAFLSYSHKDAVLADWLHAQLEQYRVPSSLVGQLTEHGTIPKRLSPIFRDQHELAAAHDLGEEIKQALAHSQFLIVLCSPEAAISQWTNAEIELFKRDKPDGCVLAAIAAGEPFASELAGREAEECFPPALRQRYDRRGRPTGKRAEPLAADLRSEGEERRLGLLKLIAGMLGVGLDDLVQRDSKRRQRRLAFVAAAALAGMTITSGLAIAAVHARDAAREQRREAEGLVAFMLGDLKDKLEPIGRLDALDGVGARVLAYYSKQHASELPDGALLQRSKALSLMGEVANARGNLDEAARLYSEASAGTAEAVRRQPDDPQRLFDHAQNIFWVGDVSRQRGDLPRAEQALREYKSLANRMVALQPESLKYRMEVQYAEADLGVVLYYERRFSDAARQFAAALQTIEAVASIDRNNVDYAKSVPDSLAWLADAEFAEGRIADATADRRRQIALLQSLASKTGDARDQEALIYAHQSLGQLLAASGDLPAAAAELSAAIEVADRLLPTEPANIQWMNDAQAAKLSYAQILLASGRAADASAQIDGACLLAKKLLATDRTSVIFQRAMRDCLLTGAQVALASGDGAAAIARATRALALAKSIRSYDVGADRFKVVKAQRLIGDAQQRTGNSAAAQASWLLAGQLLPANVPEQPGDMAEHLIVLERLGRASEGQAIADRLSAIGYRRSDL